MRAKLTPPSTARSRISHQQLQHFSDPFGTVDQSRNPTLLEVGG